MLSRLRVWLLAPVFNELGTLRRHLANSSGSVYRNHAEVREDLSEIKRLFIRPEGSSMGILNSMEIQNEIKNGNAMREHQLRRREKELLDLTARINQLQTALAQVESSNKVYRSENMLLTAELSAIKIVRNEVKADTRKTKLGSVKPGRKSPRAKATKRVEKAK